MSGGFSNMRKDSQINISNKKKCAVILALFTFVYYGLTRGQETNINSQNEFCSCIICIVSFMLLRCDMTNKVFIWIREICRKALFILNVRIFKFWFLTQFLLIFLKLNYCPRFCLSRFVYPSVSLPILCLKVKRD